MSPPRRVWLCLWYHARDGAEDTQLRSGGFHSEYMVFKIWSPTTMWMYLLEYFLHKLFSRLKRMEDSEKAFQLAGGPDHYYSVADSCLSGLFHADWEPKSTVRFSTGFHKVTVLLATFSSVSPSHIYTSKLNTEPSWALRLDLHLVKPLEWQLAYLWCMRENILPNISLEYLQNMNIQGCVCK